METVISHSITKCSITINTDTFSITGGTNATKRVDLNVNAFTTSTDTNSQSSITTTTGILTATTIAATSVGTTAHINAPSTNHSASSVTSITTSNPLLLPHGVTTIVTTSSNHSIIPTTISITGSINASSQSASDKTTLATHYQGPNIIGVTTIATSAGLSTTAITTFSHNSPTSQSNDINVYFSAGVISLASAVIIIIIIIIVAVVGIVASYKRRKVRNKDGHGQIPLNEPIKNETKGQGSSKGPDPIYSSITLNQRNFYN